HAMSEPTDPAGSGPPPKGSSPAPGFGRPADSTASGPSTAASSSSSGAGSSRPEETTAPTEPVAPAAATTALRAASRHRAEGAAGGLSTAHSGGAAGRAAPVIPPTERRGPLESVLVLRRIDPWSAFTTVLGLMFALYIVWMVAIGVTYLLLSGMGVWDRLGGLLSGVAGDESADVIGPSTIFLYSGGVGLLNVLLLSILATLAVFIYNLAAGLTGGGVQVTLSDRHR